VQTQGQTPEELAELEVPEVSELKALMLLEFAELEVPEAELKALMLLELAELEVPETQALISRFMATVEPMTELKVEVFTEVRELQELKVEVFTEVRELVTEVRS